MCKCANVLICKCANMQMCECANGHIKRSVNKKLSLGSATIGGQASGLRVFNPQARDLPPVADYAKRPSMISLSTSLMSNSEARTCCGMKLVAVIPGVVLISSKLICSLPFSPERI